MASPPEQCSRSPGSFCGKVRPASCLNEYRPSSRMNVNASEGNRPGKGPKDVQGGGSCPRAQARVDDHRFNAVHPRHPRQRSSPWQASNRGETGLSLGAARTSHTCGLRCGVEVWSSLSARGAWYQIRARRSVADLTAIWRSGCCDSRAPPVRARLQRAGDSGESDVTAGGGALVCTHRHRAF